MECVLPFLQIEIEIEIEIEGHFSPLGFHGDPLATL